MEINKIIRIRMPYCVVLMFAIVYFFFGGCSSLQKSDHCDGKKFFNYEKNDHGFTDMVKWLWKMDTVDWPSWINDPMMPPPDKYAPKGTVRITHINHSTFLIQFDDLNILTDPILSMTAGPVSFIGSKRIRNPGVKFEDIPKIDYILISHNHYDHMDLPTLEMFVKRDSPVVISGLGNKSFLEKNKIKKAVELDWWGKISTGIKFSVSFVPAHHGSGRGLFDENETLWGGFVIERNGYVIYFAGDSAYADFLKKIHEHYPEVDMSILPIGSYESREFMKTQHMNPEEAVLTHLLLNSLQTIGMHYATFLEHPEQSIDAHEKDLNRALEKYSVGINSFIILKFGESLEISLEK
ncbi:MAG TPA: MBL fold metallo-hydrolase [Spirochaetota bacterium]|nr:MBL fold metallo-hydrolase [Spirochaetota bacterium]